MNKEEIIKFEDINKKFLNTLNTSIIPFLGNLEKLEFSNIDPTMQDKMHLKQSIELIRRYSDIEAEKIRRVPDRNLVKDIKTEMETVHRILAKAKRITLNAKEQGQLELLEGVENDCKNLLGTLQNINKDLETLEKKN